MNMEYKKIYVVVETNIKDGDEGGFCGRIAYASLEDAKAEYERLKKQMRRKFAIGEQTVKMTELSDKSWVCFYEKSWNGDKNLYIISIEKLGVRGAKEDAKSPAKDKVVKLSWEQLRLLFMKYNDMKTYDDDGNREKKEPLHAVVVFKSSNWPDENYSLESRSYRISSDSKCFYSYMGGNSCRAASLDGSDPCVDITKYDWDIDYCYLLSD